MAGNAKEKIGEELLPFATVAREFPNLGFDDGRLKNGGVHKTS